MNWHYQSGDDQMRRLESSSSSTVIGGEIERESLIFFSRVPRAPEFGNPRLLVKTIYRNTTAGAFIIAAAINSDRVVLRVEYN